MTSDHKSRTNRANARASTGPKTTEGRARVARNAFRHGLSLPICSDPALSQKVETLARQIAGPDAGAVSLEFARQIAEAQMDLRRVREARHQFLSSTMSDQYYDSHANVRAKENLMGRIFGPRGPEMSSESFAAFLTSIPQVQHKLALIVAQEAKKLLAMDRYERRAWSNRNSAIRAFDAARQQSWQRTP